MIVSECDAVGGFVGESISEPPLQVGIMVSIAGYLVYLQPAMMLALLAVFFPQFVFVPFMQLSINKRARTRIATLRDGKVLVAKEVATNRPAIDKAAPV